ncbi:WD40 repeat domain-containing protein [Microcystis aeruginosa]|jgi:COMPASS component SWD3|uniref:Similarity with tr/Q7ND80/Q7ND80 n=2 Tax=Microcystis TaxID=1125 RepID=I4IKX6_MICAE|nr:WD40 repeat domain-containing protein [Microcystis aeruginosa]CCI34950.1 Similarity with tr/Q7ND80/Q7ND80 [Microcystis aeruginosa PCC 9701]
MSLKSGDHQNPFTGNCKMTDHRPHGLELAEYIALGLTLLTLIAMGAGFLPLFLLVVTFGLNILNRLRERTRQLQRLTEITGHLQEQWEEEKEALSAQIQSLSPAAAKDNARAVAELEENILALEQSYNQIIQYINRNALLERIEHLEKSYSRLQREILPINEESADITATKAENEPQITLPTLNLTLTSPPVPIPHWHYYRRLTAHREMITAIAITEDQRFLISVSWDRTLKIWDFARGTLINTLEAHDQGILALAVTGNGDYHLATGGFDQTVKLWTLASDGSNLELDQIFLGHLGSIHGLDFASRWHFLVSGSYDQTLKQWNLEQETEEFSSYDSLGAIYALAVAPNQDFIAAAGGDGTVSLWQLGSGEKIAVLSGNVSSVQSLAIAADSQIIAAGCVDGTVKIWQYDPEKSGYFAPIRVINAHNGQVTSLVFAEEGQWLFTGGTDGEIKIWLANSQQAIATLTAADGRSSPISSLVLSPDYCHLAAAAADGSITIWENIT